MPDDLDLMQLASTGQTLARLDLVEYLAVHVVLAWPVGGAPAIYCAYRDWAERPVARLAAKEQEIIELTETLERWAAETLEQTQRASTAEARIRELEAQLAERPSAETPVQNQAKMFEKQAAALDDQTEAPPDPIICPDCGKDGWVSARALQMHRQRAHQGMVALRTPAAPAQFVEDQGWRCAAKECSGAHARDLHDLAHCTQHAVRSTNGHEIAA